MGIFGTSFFTVDLINFFIFFVFCFSKLHFLSKIQLTQEPFGIHKWYDHMNDFQVEMMNQDNTGSYDTCENDPKSEFPRGYELSYTRWNMRNVILWVLSSKKVEIRPIKNFSKDKIQWSRAKKMSNIFSFHSKRDLKKSEAFCSIQCNYVIDFFLKVDVRFCCFFKNST